MTSQEIEAIAGGYHGDPFHVLGPHSVSREQWEVRAFLPQAETAAVVLNGALDGTLAGTSYSPTVSMYTRLLPIPPRFMYRWNC